MVLGLYFASVSYIQQRSMNFGHFSVTVTFWVFFLFKGDSTVEECCLLDYEL